MLDSFFSGEITKENMIKLTQQYDDRLTLLRNHSTVTSNDEGTKNMIHSELVGILTGQTESEMFYKTILESLTVFKNGMLQLRLKHLPHVFRFSY